MVLYEFSLPHQQLAVDSGLLNIRFSLPTAAFTAYIKDPIYKLFPLKYPFRVVFGREKILFIFHPDLELYQSLT
jgi:hypothetical protein